MTKHTRRVLELGVGLALALAIVLTVGADWHQRTAARADRPRTADVDRRGTRRLAVAHRDIEVGDGALQRTRDARIGAFGELPAVHLIHGADQVAALDRTVAHDDHLFEDLLVLAQRHVERTPGADLLFEGLESQVHEDQHGAASGNGERVAAVGIGGDAVGRALFYDRSADERSLAAVGQLSGHRDPILRMGRKNEYAQQQTHQKKADDAPVLLRSSQIHFHRVKVNINSNCVERLGNSRFWQIFI